MSRKIESIFYMNKGMDQSIIYKEIWCMMLRREPVASHIRYATYPTMENYVKFMHEVLKYQRKTHKRFMKFTENQLQYQHVIDILGPFTRSKDN